jgi:hypothetical protein
MLLERSFFHSMEHPAMRDVACWPFEDRAVSTDAELFRALRAVHQKCPHIRNISTIMFNIVMRPLQADKEVSHDEDTAPEQNVRAGKHDFEDQMALYLRAITGEGGSLFGCNCLFGIFLIDDGVRHKTYTNPPISSRNDANSKLLSYRVVTCLGARE